MKRFLSLVLSALFVFQLGNASCDAASHYRNNPSNYSMGATPQGQPMVIMQASPYVPQQQPIINVTAPEPTPQQHNITIQPPEIKQDFKMKVDATTTADKLWSWLKIALGLALGYVVLNASWPIIKFFTGISNPMETVKGWGKGAIKWVKGIWDEESIGKENQNKEEQEEEEQEKEFRGSDYSENGSTSESSWRSWLSKAIISIITFCMMRGKGASQMP